jgi:hypothetical protein
MRVPNQLHSNGFRLVGGLFLAVAVGFAQSQAPGWRRADEPAPTPAPAATPTPTPTPAPAATPDQSADPSTPVASPDLDQNGQPAGQLPFSPPANFGVPPHLIIPAGRFINVVVDQPLSSDRNQAGDLFSATVIDPVVVDGIVVVQRGQHVSGQVTQVDKGGRVSGVAKLGLQLTQLNAVDGQQLPIRTQFISRNAPTTVGRDVGAIAGTTALGAAVGAAAAWGTGAAIGAGAGAVLGIAGVLLTRGAPAIVFPETPLTFRIEQAVDVNTQRAPQAFQPVNPNEYQQPPAPQLRTGPGPGPYGPGSYGPGPYGAGPYGPGYGYPYPAPLVAYGSPFGYPYGYPYPYFWGPSFGVVIGRGYFYRGGFYGYRGFRR